MRLSKTNDPRIYNFCSESTGHDRSDVLTGAGWVARITGTHPQWNFAREFVTHQRGSDWWFTLLEGDIYEYRGLYAGGSRYSYNKYGGESGFFIIRNGALHEIGEAKVRDELRRRALDVAASTACVPPTTNNSQ